MTRDRLTDAVVLVVDGEHGIDKLAMYAEISARGRDKLAEIVLMEPSPMVERAMLAFDASQKLTKTCREIMRHPRYQDRAPRSPKPKFKKGR